MLKEFRTFLMRGNVVDLAVAVIMGGAFGAIVNSLVKDILMPPLGLLLNRVSFSDLFVNMSGQHYVSLKAAQDAGAPTLNYGLFIQAVIDFVIMAFAIFVLVRLANRFHRLQTTAPAAGPKTKECPYCLSAIAPGAKRCPHCTSELGGGGQP